MKYLLIILFFCSCGTRKTDTTQNENIIIENQYDTGSKIVLGNTFTYTPFNPLKGMVINGKTYTNVIIKSDKSVTKETYKYFNVYRHYRLDENKQTTRTDNTWLYIGLFLVFVLGVLAWFKLPSFRKGS